jgi:hypothetical protein
MKLPPPERDSAFAKLLDKIRAGTDTQQDYDADRDELDRHHAAHGSRMEQSRRDSLSDARLLADSIDHLADAIRSSGADAQAAHAVGGVAVGAALHHAITQSGKQGP